MSLNNYAVFHSAVNVGKSLDMNPRQKPMERRKRRTAITATTNNKTNNRDN